MQHDLSKIIVYLWPSKEYKDNDFIILFQKAVLETGVTVHSERIDPIKGLPDTGGIFIMHWPERIFWGKSGGLIHYLMSFIKVKKFAHNLKIFRKTGGSVIWIANNLEPHDMDFFQRVRWRFLLTMLSGSIDSILSLSKGTLPLIRTSFKKKFPESQFGWIQHPAYPQFKFDETRAVNGRFCFGIEDEDILCCIIGHLRPYKGISQLIPKFTEATINSSQKISLALAGKPVSRRAGKRLRAELGEYANISLDLTRVSDDHVHEMLCSSDYFLFPSEKYLHSGSMIAALSSGITVVAHKTNFTSSLSDLMPDGHIISFEEFFEAIDRGALKKRSSRERHASSICAAKKMSQEKIAGQLSRVFSEICNT